MGLETGWNCHISLTPNGDGHGDGAPSSPSQAGSVHDDLLPGIICVSVYYVFQCSWVNSICCCYELTKAIHEVVNFIEFVWINLNWSNFNLTGEMKFQWTSDFTSLSVSADSRDDAEGPLLAEDEGQSDLASFQATESDVPSFLADGNRVCTFFLCALICSLELF